MLFLALLTHITLSNKVGSVNRGSSTSFQDNQICDPLPSSFTDITNFPVNVSKFLYRCGGYYKSRDYCQNKLIQFFSCTFTSIRQTIPAAKGAAIFLTSTGIVPALGDIIIHNCLFEKCEGDQTGSIYINIALIDRFINITNNKFLENKSRGKGRGGAIYLRASFGIIANNKFIDNCGMNGSALYLESDGYSDGSYIVGIENNMFITTEFTNQKKSIEDNSSLSLIYFTPTKIGNFEFVENKIIGKLKEQTFIFDSCESNDIGRFIFKNNCIEFLEEGLLKLKTSRVNITNLTESAFTQCSNKKATSLKNEKNKQRLEFSEKTEQTRIIKDKKKIRRIKISDIDENPVEKNSVKSEKNGNIKKIRNLIE